MIQSIISSTLRRSLKPQSTILWTGDWACRSCRRQTVHNPRFSSSDTSSQKPYYITTPIFYVNAAPHVGHLYTMVLTDIHKRWQVLRGRKAILCTGTDEHGLKIQQASARAQMEPGEFCDQGAEIFKNLARRADLANEHFVRTTDPDHKEAVQYFWQLLRDKGHIYESKHEGWYCVSDETFYPESAIEKRLDPFNGKIFMASCETGKEVEWTSEPNYHFRLSAFKKPLLEFYKANPQFVVPATRMKNVVQWVSDGLEDLSVSRPVDRLTWGIRVPDDESQTIYVWLDALINYITKAGYPGVSFYNGTGGWPADVQVIGKDIVRFHCIYWPAFLLALDLPPPKQILTHAHWTLGREKMAKSTGNVVNPFFAFDRFGVDVMRYYLAHDGGLSEDSDYSNHFIVERYKKGLSGGLGNLVSRLTRPKAWSVSKAVIAAHAGNIPPPNDETEKQRTLIASLPGTVAESFDQLNASAGLHHIMNVVYETNKYLQLEEPWALAKTGRPADQARVLRTVYHSAEAIRVVGILLQPYMPGKAKQLLDMIGVEDSKRSFSNAVFGSDSTYGEARVPLGKCAFDSLFPPLSLET